MISESLSLYQSMAERETVGVEFSLGVERAFVLPGDITTMILPENCP
jgi:hypothetical protein